MVVSISDIWALPNWLKFLIFLGTLVAINLPLPFLNVSIGTTIVKPIVEFPFIALGVNFSYELFVIIVFLSPIILFIFKYGNPSRRSVVLRKS